MNAPELREFRKRRGWSQRQLGDLISRGLDKDWKNGAATIGAYELGKRSIPTDVDAFLTRLALEEPEFAVLDGEHEVPFEPGDIPPPAPEQDKPGLPMLPGGTHMYAKICEEFFEIGATGCGLLAEMTDSDRLRADRDVLLRDKENLGKVWGRLAEKNETFRRMITGGPTDAAIYLQIVLVTGATANRIARNHRQPPPSEQPVWEPQPQPEPEPEGEVMYGDGAVIDISR